MSTVNVMAREVGAKVVFYGPGLSGKTTSLKRIYESIRPSLRGELMSLPTEADRTLFFDFLPVRVERVGDYSLRLALYTVPGQVFYNATRKLVLQGADGVIFVADSNEAADDSNRESMANLEENLLEQGIRLDQFPFVIQYNKRDIPNPVPIEHMRAVLNPRGVPDFETCAMNGQGVLEAMKEVIRLVIKDLRHRKVVPEPKQRSEQAPAKKEIGAGLEEQIHAHLKATEHDAPHVSSPVATAAKPRVVATAPSPVFRGTTAALAPASLVDTARLADMCFAKGDWKDCVRACQEGVRRGLSYAGAASYGEQAFLLGLDGRDVLNLFRISALDDARIDDAAFSIYVFMQTLIRLNAAGLPIETQ